MRVFVTGGAGYIGSHTLVQLVSAGHNVCVYDNFCHSSPVALARVRQLTVRELITAYERASGRAISFKLAGRRSGDIASSYASTAKAAQQIGWCARLGLDAMCQSPWRWQSQNPLGFADI